MSDINGGAATTAVDPDHALSARLRDGGEAARGSFEQLAVRHQDWVYRLCLRRLRHPEDARDAAQEALLKAFLGASRFQGRSRFRTWLATIVERECIDAARHRARHAVSVDLAAQIATFHRQHMPQPGPHAGRDLRAHLVSLPPSSRDVIELRFFQGRGIHELAAILGIGPSAAKMRLHRSIEQLRARLGALDATALA